MCVQHDISAGPLFIDQAQYIKSVLSHYGMTPLPPCAQFQPTFVEDHAAVSSYPYLEVISSLTFASIGTHPDICTAFRALSLFATTFSPQHLSDVKHTLRYLAKCPT